MACFRPRLTSIALAWGLLASAAHAQPPAAERPEPEAAASPIPAPAEAPSRAALQQALRGGGPELTADEAAARAVETAPAVAEAQAAVRVSEAAVAGARAALLPRTTLRAHYTRVGGFEDGSLPMGGDGGFDAEAANRLLAGVDDPEARQLLGALVDQQSSLGQAGFHIPRNQYGLGARVDVPLSDLVTAVAPRLRAARARAEAERLRIEATHADVALAAREAFYRYAQARASVEVARASVERAAAHRDRVRALAVAGRATEVDALETEAHLARAESAVAEARAAEQGAAIALASLLHRDAEAFSVAEPVLEAPPAPPPDAQALVERAWRQRPDLRATELLVRAQGELATAAGAERYPRLGAFAGYDWARPNPLVVPPNDEPEGSWRVGVAVSWSPDGMVRARHAADERQAERARLRARLRGARDRVRVDVLQAWQHQKATQASYEAARRETEASEARRRARVAELAAGRATATDLLDAETDLVRAQLDLLAASAQGRIARARLRHALGQSDIESGETTP